MLLAEQRRRPVKIEFFFFGVTTKGYGCIFSGVTRRRGGGGIHLLEEADGEGGGQTQAGGGRERETGGCKGSEGGGIRRGLVPPSGAAADVAGGWTPPPRAPRPPPPPPAHARRPPQSARVRPLQHLQHQVLPELRSRSHHFRVPTAGSGPRVALLLKEKFAVAGNLDWSANPVFYPREIITFCPNKSHYIHLDAFHGLLKLTIIFTWLLQFHAISGILLGEPNFGPQVPTLGSTH